MRIMNTYVVEVSYGDRDTTYVIDAKDMHTVLGRLQSIVLDEEIKSVSVKGSIFNTRDPN